MKKIIIPVFLLLGSFCFSQSVTEKYNSIYNRYEYYNSSGNIIGYKKYNNLSRQWEYYDVNKTQYERQPRQYGDYIQPYNFDLMQKALSQKQSNYDSNYSVVNQYLENLYTLIKAKMKYAKLTESKLKYLQNVIDNMNSITKADLSSTSTATQAISYLKKEYEEIDSW